MNILRELDAACPTWRDTVSSDPLEAAVELGLLDETDTEPEVSAELDFNDERANIRRMLEYYHVNS